MKCSAIHSEVHHTAMGTPYLKAPGVVVIGVPQVSLVGITGFLEGFDKELGFPGYLYDRDRIDDCTKLVKFAGQLCYASLGPRRTRNSDAQKYIDHILESNHGSVCEHASISFLLYGIDRAVTHELVRHRAGVAISQISQRFVNGKVLRFVERPEYQNDAILHERFEKRINRAAVDYEDLAQNLWVMQNEGEKLLSGGGQTDERKKVNQTARSCLPNETEAPVVWTANLRALRHVIEMRANKAADTTIRELAVRLCLCAKEVAPMFFKDHEIVQLPDGTRAVTTKWRKV